MINPIPGQEEENAEFLEEIGVAIWLKPKDDMGKAIKEITKAEKLNELKENAKKTGNPNAAGDICDMILKKYLSKKREV